MNQIPSACPAIRPRLAIIKEHGSHDENNSGLPFCSYADTLVLRQVEKTGIAPTNCFLSHIYPFLWSGAMPVPSELYWPHWENLRNELIRLKPDIILTLGQLPYKLLNPIESATLSATRGYPFISPITNSVVIPTLDPLDVLANFGDSFYLYADIKKAVTYALSGGWQPPKRDIRICRDFHEARFSLEHLLSSQKPFAFDIEGYPNHQGVRCISFAVSPYDCFVIPFTRAGESFWPTVQEETELWRLISLVLNSPVKKICHNAQYEIFVLLNRHKITVAPPVEDLYLLWHSRHVEAEKSLNVVASILSSATYWKDERDNENFDTFLNYNGTDSAVTFECWEKLGGIQSEHEKQCHALLYPFVYMTSRGVRFNKAKANELTEIEERKLAPVLQELANHCGREINPKSAKDKAWLLYEHLNLQPMARYGEKTTELIILKYWHKTRNPILKTLLAAVYARTRISDIQKLTTSESGRLHSSFNIAGTDTWRISSSASPLSRLLISPRGKLSEVEIGTNLQNVTPDLRICFTADQGMHFFQCDLEGADAWTVAADLAAIGYPTMLDDLLYGLRPAKILLLMLEELRAGRSPAAVNKLSRAELKILTAKLDTKNKLASAYLCMKRVQHGTNYGMQSELVSDVIFKDTEAELYLDPIEAGRYQQFYEARYNSRARLEHLKNRLRETAEFTTAAGTFRRFYDRRPGPDIDHKVLGKLLSNEPQVNTTYVTNYALNHIWHASQNRRGNGGLFLEPLIQVHDALCGQFPQGLESFAKELLLTAFDKTLIVSGIKIKIPFEGRFGPSWGELTTPL